MKSIGIWFLFFEFSYEATKAKLNDAHNLLLSSFALILSSVLTLLRDLLMPVAFAQVPSSLDPQTTACNSIFSTGGFGSIPGIGFKCVEQYIGNLSFVVIAFAATLSLILLIVNGFRYMIGPAVPGGSSDAAKKGIGAALLGVVLSLLSYIILDTIVSSVTH